MRDICTPVVVGNVVHCKDHMPHETDIRISIKNQPVYFKNTYDDFFKIQNISIDDKNFMFGHYLWFEDYHDKSIYTGDAFLNISSLFQLLNWDTVPEFQVTKSFTFMSNKARAHRVASAMVIANVFNDCSFNYSFNNNPNSNIILEELLFDCDYQFDKNLILPDLWVDNTYRITPVAEPWGGKNTGRENHHNFIDVLYEKLYENSAVSLITEPPFFEKGFSITEKTIMSMYAGQFMIFLGNYRAPEFLKKMGFDVFDDIIDHSYQYIEHPFKRIAEALLRNRELLMDVDKLDSFRKNNIARFNQNLKILRNKEQLKHIIAQLNSNMLVK